DVMLWVDRGTASAEVLAREAREGPGTPVLGTEVIADEGAARAALAVHPIILSLDHDMEGPLGPAAVHSDPSLWPESVIVMTLGRVGSLEGPDLDRLRAVKDLAGGRRVFAAGGVRDRADLLALAEAGAAGVLVASALHDGRLTAADLEAFR